MSKNLMIGVAVAVLLVLGVGGYVMMGKKTEQTSTTTTTPAAEEVSPAPAKQSGSLRQLLAAGVAQKCTFSSEGTQGTVYTGGGKMRGDMQTTSDERTIVSHMIVDGTTSYIWMDGQATGFKTSWETTQTGTAGGVDPNKNVDYDCGAWVTDAGQFAMPAGVTFAAMGNITVPTGAAGESMTPKTGAPPECATCAAFTGAAKTQCLTSLGCN